MGFFCVFVWLVCFVLNKVGHTGEYNDSYTYRKDKGFSFLNSQKHLWISPSQNLSTGYIKEMQLLNKLSNILVKNAFKLLNPCCIIFSGEISI